MSIWVLAADASRARIFEAVEHGASLTQREELVHPASRLRPRELVSDRPGTGRTRPAGGGVGHSVGHEHDAANQEHERFAREIADRLDAACREGQLERLHLLAPPRFLGSLRAHLHDATLQCVASEHAVEVTGETPDRIRARLPAHL